MCFWIAAHVATDPVTQDIIIKMDILIVDLT